MSDADLWLLILCAAGVVGFLKETGDDRERRDAAMRRCVERRSVIDRLGCRGAEVFRLGPPEGD